VSYQLYPDLEPAVEAALRSSIRRWGVIYPIVTDQAGRVIDGHHRQRIAQELGQRPKIEVRRVRSEDEALELARTLNEDRRQLPLDQRREVVADLRSEGHSVRAIGGALGVSKSTIQDDLTQLSGAGQLKQPETVRGLDGKARPATRPEPTRRPALAREAPLVGVDPQAGEIANEADPDLDAVGQHLAENVPELTNGPAYRDVSKALREVWRTLKDIDPEVAWDGAQRHPHSDLTMEKVDEIVAWLSSFRQGRRHLKVVES